MSIGVNYMNRFKYILLLILFLYSGCGCKKSPRQMPNPDNWKDDKVEEIADHPRLLLFKGEEKDIKHMINSDPYYRKIHDAIMDEADQIVRKKELSRKLEGRRLLPVSMEFLKRTFYLSYAYRLTEDNKYLKKVEREMLAAADFIDWHPEHFLDVAEIAMGMAIGYDWLYDKLSDTSKEKIRTAIVDKALKPSLKYNDWANKNNNWNQVCNSSLSFAAIAVKDFYPTLCDKIISRAFRTITLPMEQYEPDGLYQEGYGYWNYGTSFNVLFLYEAKKYLKDDKGLSNSKGFLKTAEFMCHMVGPTGVPYNWGDNEPKAVFSAAMMWFADKTGDNSVLWSEKNILGSNSNVLKDRLLPAAMIFGKNVSLKEIKAPEKKCYFGTGPTPIALMRSSWTDPDAIYVGYKLGSPTIPHSHLDIGSFILETDGIRWAEDPSREKYNLVEKYGNIWNYEQDSFRWKIFRLGAMSHNLITVNGTEPIVTGKAGLDKISDNENFKYAVSDLSQLYIGQLAKYRRGIGIKDNKYVIVRDDFKSLNRETTLRWVIFTSASVQLRKNKAELSIKDKRLIMKVKSSGKIKMKEWTASPQNEWDSDNPGKRLIGFECKISPDTEGFIEVILIPEKNKTEANFLDKDTIGW